MGKTEQHLGEELLSAFIDGEVAPDEREGARAHLAACAACSARLSAYRSLDELISSPAGFDCHTVLPLVSAELDRELDDDVALFAREHLASCARCRAARDSWHEFEATLRALPLLTPSRRVDDAIAAVVERRRPVFGVPAFATAVAARAAIAIVVVTALASGSVLLPPATPEQANAPQGAAAVVAAMQTVVLNTRTNRLYILYPDTGVIVVRDVSNDSELSRVAVGGRPTALAVNEETNSVYVLDGSSGTITEIDGGKNAVVASLAVTVPGVPTSLQVDPSKGKLIIGAVGALASSITVIDSASRTFEATRAVDVSPIGVVVDVASGRTFLLSLNGTAVLDSATYERVALLPGRAVGAVPDGNGVTAVLMGSDGKARVVFYGVNAQPVDIAGTPLAITTGPDGTFAVLVEVDKHARIALVSRSGVTMSQDLSIAARHITYEPSSRRFALVGAGGETVTIASQPTQVATGSTPSGAQGTTPGASVPSAQVRQPQSAPQPPSAPTVSREPIGERPGSANPQGMPSAARLLWEGTYFLELPAHRKPTALVSRGWSIWFVDENGGVNVLDTRFGASGRVASLPRGAKISSLGLGQASLYALDSTQGFLYVVDIVSGSVSPVTVPFGRSVVALTVAPNDHVWFAASSVGALVDFDPATRDFQLVEAGRDVSSVAADIAGRIWFTAPAGERHAILGAYDTTTKRRVEYRITDESESQALFADSNGTVWVASASGQLLALRGNEARVVAQADVAKRRVFALAPDGSAWLLRVTEQDARLSSAATPESAITLPRTVNGFVVDDRGRAWVADPVAGGFYIVANPETRP